LYQLKTNCHPERSVSGVELLQSKSARLYGVPENACIFGADLAAAGSRLEEDNGLFNNVNINKAPCSPIRDSASRPRFTRVRLKGSP